MVMEALALAREHELPAFVSEQPPYNLLDRRIENELLPLCERYDLAVLPWSPLAGGILTGRYDSVDAVPDDSRAARLPQTRQRLTEKGLAVADAVGRLAHARGLTTSQLALLWVRDQPAVTAPIIGPRTLDQLDDALAVLDLSLDDETRAELDALVHPGNAIVDFHNTAGWVKATVS
jgi:1-deoxyxylulose-5-phosphate synthase